MSEPYPKCGMTPCSKKTWNGCVNERGESLIGHPEQLDLRAIRERCLFLAIQSSSEGKSAALAMDEAGADIDALLAEVERLQRVLMIAFPDAIDRAFVSALPVTLDKYLSRTP